MAVPKKRDPRRRVPDLPPDDDLALAQIEDGNLLESAHVTSGDFSDATLQQLAVRRSVVEGVSFAQARFRSVRLRDVRFLRCDLSNAIMRGMEAIRVEFVDCRLLGLSAAECKIEDLLLARCDSRYAQFNAGTAHHSEFIDSQLQEADFRATNLENTKWIRSSLARADLRGARLSGADLRGAEMEAILVDAPDVAGAIVTPSQAMDFARLLRLQIR